MKVIALTGGPCGGKSTFLKALREQVLKYKQHVVVLPEMASIVRDAGFRLAYAPIETQRMLAEGHMSMLRAARALFAGTDTVVLCDRGLLDALAYQSSLDFCRCTGMSRAEALRLYDGVVHLDTDDKRYDQTGRAESAEEALAVNQRIRHAWDGHERRFVVGNYATWEEKYDTVVSAVKVIAEGLEYEVKYWCKTPDVLGPPRGITQYYLRDGSRLRVYNDGEAVLCNKTQIGGGHREQEFHLPAPAMQYLSRPENVAFKIVKTRSVVPGEDRPVVFDHFPALGVTVLECELLSPEDTYVPRCIKGDYDVLDPYEWSNLNLAKRLA